MPISFSASRRYRAACDKFYDRKDTLDMAVSLQVELGQTPGALQRLRLCGSYVSIIGQELLGTIKLLPYGNYQATATKVFAVMCQESDDVPGHLTSLSGRRIQSTEAS